MSSSLHVSLQRYRTGDVPKRQRRLCEGRSNAAAARQRERDAVERAFVARLPPSPQSRTTAACAHGALTMGEQHVRADYCSAYAATSVTRRARREQEYAQKQQQGQNASVSADRSCVYTAAQMHTMLRTLAPELLTTAATRRSRTATHTVIRPPPTQTPPHEPREQARGVSAAAAAPTHPVVASLLYDNVHGKGHTVHPDDFFFSAAHATHAHADVRGSSSSSSSSTSHGGGGGDRRRDAKAPSQPPPPPSPPLPPQHVNASGGQLEYGDPVTDAAWCRSKVVARHHLRHDRQAKACGEASCAVAEGAAEAEVATTAAAAATVQTCADTRDAWVRQFVPTVQPYKVERCLGRCGRTDYRLTFADVQPAPSSDMYASAAERFRTVQHVPLATPNVWQEPRRCRGRVSTARVHEM